jgi:hypothetical protein
MNRGLAAKKMQNAQMMPAAKRAIPIPAVIRQHICKRPLFVALELADDNAATPKPIKVMDAAGIPIAACDQMRRLTGFPTSSYHQRGPNPFQKMRAKPVETPMKARSTTQAAGESDLIIQMPV